MTPRQYENQKAWAARRRGALDTKRTRQADLRTQAVPRMLTVRHDITPDPADYDQLLAEADFCREGIECMVAGTDVLGCAFEIPKHLLGRVAVAAWLHGGLSPEKMREVIECTWGLGTPFVVEAAGSRLFEMLRYCEWPLPSRIGDEVTIWRGARGVTVEQAGAGLCWTLDFDTACAWLRVLQMKWGVQGVPVVVRRTVPRSAIAMYHTEGGLDEVVIDAEPGGAVLDGSQGLWDVARVRWRDRMIAEGRITMYGEQGHADYALALARLRTHA